MATIPGDGTYTVGEDIQPGTYKSTGNADIKHQIQRGTGIANLLIFGAIGMIVLILACINYVSLSTAGLIDQSSKVGIRKMLGASTRHVVAQYLVESWLLAMVAMIVSLVWIELVALGFRNDFWSEAARS